MSHEDLSSAALFELDGPFADLLAGDVPWEALDRLKGWLARHARRDLRGTVHASAVVEGEVALGEGSVIEAGAYVRGPCWIGRDVEVRHGAYVRGDVLVGDGCVVGHATEVKGSIFLPGAKAGHFAYVGDSILGREVNLGAGTKLANLRLAGDEVMVRVRGALVATGRRKLGAILGDRAQTGCNSVTNPGTVLGRGAIVHPCAVVSGFHAAGSVVR